jgi:EAL domain-containing protein (putative c-di-GMP-specific phosphodiesterase class I)/GGDEF domain-containing protein
MIAFKINRLQKINTLFGLETGDNILKMYASALSGIAPKSAILGRLGPDDFVILAEHIPSANITRMVKEVTFIMESNCADTSLPALLKEQIRFMAAVCYYDGVDDVMTLYNKCSVTLFNRSEKETNNVYYFDESIEMQVCERELLEQELLDAYKSGEFELYYQPKFNVSTGDILGLEALIRWNHPRKGIMYPDEFIPIAEEMGLLSKIDDWGLRTACMQNKIWQKLGYKPLIVSVNVSKDQFFRGNIVDRVKDALLYSRLEPKYLELELTETMAFNDIAETKKILQELKELGVSISMDDFGTGFSCLSSLKELCIDLLKIDRSLITDIHENITSGYITKAIVDLAKAMHLEILAEGVENVGQLESLANLGCDFAQGYYFDKPLPAMEFERKYLLSSVKNI